VSEFVPDPNLPFTGGPYLIVAVPGTLEDLIPLNVSAYVREWEESLRPTGDLVAALRNFAQENWYAREHFCTVSFSTLPMLREASSDPDLVTAFMDADGDYFHTGAHGRLENFATDDGILPMALPALLGMAVVSTSLMHAGRAGRSLWQRITSNQVSIEAARLEVAKRVGEHHGEGRYERIQREVTEYTDFLKAYEGQPKASPE
jgi:hypothetical protein